MHHLIAIGVDDHGRLKRLFTVNHWVVGGTWMDAGETIAQLPSFDVHLDRPSYLVNRWLTAVVRLFEDEIAGLIRLRDDRIAAHKPITGEDAKEDRALEVTSLLEVDLPELAYQLDVR